MPTKPSLSGQLADFDLPQITTILHAASCTGALDLEGPFGQGRLHVQDGTIVAAEVGGTSGELAVFEVLRWTAGEFRFAREPLSVAHNVHRSNASLLLDGMRLIDEAQSDRLAFVRQPGADPDLPDGVLRQVFGAVQEPAGIAQVAQACGLSRLEACYQLEALERLGVLSRCSLDADSSAGAASTDGRVRVLIVDDSSLMRKVLKRLYESDAGLSVVGVAEDGQQALELLAKTKPDVISLDLYMPVLDGVSTLKRIMLTQPTPTVVMTSASPESLDLTFESILRFGAIDFITKPSQSRGALPVQEAHILRRVRKAARADLRGVRMLQPGPAGAAATELAVRGRARGVICASGGTGACLSYMQLLTSLPADLPFGIVGTLAFPEEFLKPFAAYLNKSTAFAVEVAREGAAIQSGVCYLANDSAGLRMVPGPSGPVLRVDRESSDVSASSLWHDAAALFDQSAVGLLLSGEGDALLPALAAIRAAGGVTLAQLPASCVDPEQCTRAREQGAVEESLLLANVAPHLSQVFMSRLRHSGWRAGGHGEAQWPRRSA